MLFSLRNKLLDDGAMLRRFRNRVRNTFSNMLGVYYDACVLTKSVSYYDAASTLLFDIADRLGLEIADDDPYTINEKLHDQLDSTSGLNIIYDFIEAHLETLFDPPSLPYGITGIDIQRVRETAMKKYDQLLKDECQPYQLCGTHIIPLIDDSEFCEIEMAATTGYDSVNKHIEKAWTLFSNRKSPDYENSIKESISAVEAMCCIITGASGAQATLGEAIKRLKDNGVHIHGAMENAFKSLYGYTSNESGIRHGGIDFKGAPAEDAKYMLVSCSAFVNYLVEKWRKVNS